MGVRGRNSDNTMIKAKLGWAPSIPIRTGMCEIYYIDICMCIYDYMLINIHICIYIRIYINIYTCIDLYMYVYINIHIYIYIGLQTTCAWIKSQIELEIADGKTGNYGTSDIVLQVTDTLDSLKK
jgi:hypothetical protein